MAEIIPVEQFSFQSDPHAIRATDDILAQTLLAVDDTPRQLLQGAIRMENTQDAWRKPFSPYALLEIVRHKITQMTQRGVIVEMTLEIVLHIIFKMSAGGDYQKHGNNLMRRVWLTLEPKSANNPNGIDWEPPRVWLFDDKQNFDYKLDRSVTRLGKREEVSATTDYTVPIQFRIKVYPQRPL